MSETRGRGSWGRTLAASSSNSSSACVFCSDVKPYLCRTTHMLSTLKGCAQVECFHGQLLTEKAGCCCRYAQLFDGSVACRPTSHCPHLHSLGLGFSLPPAFHFSRWIGCSITVCQSSITLLRPGKLWVQLPVHSRPDQMIRPPLRSTSVRFELSSLMRSMSTCRPVTAAAKVLCQPAGRYMHC